MRLRIERAVITAPRLPARIIAIVITFVMLAIPGVSRAQLISKKVERTHMNLLGGEITLDRDSFQPMKKLNSLGFEVDGQTENENFTYHYLFGFYGSWRGGNSYKEIGGVTYGDERRWGMLEFSLGLRQYSVLIAKYLQFYADGAATLMYVKEEGELSRSHYKHVGPGMFDYEFREEKHGYSSSAWAMGLSYGGGFYIRKPLGQDSLNVGVDVRKMAATSATIGDVTDHLDNYRVMFVIGFGSSYMQTH